MTQFWLCCNPAEPRNGKLFQNIKDDICLRACLTRNIWREITSNVRFVENVTDIEL